LPNDLEKIQKIEDERLLDLSFKKKLELSP
jgi:hypothetical protein